MNNATHTTASKRKNRKPRGQAVDTRFGAEGNTRKSPHNYGRTREQYLRMVNSPLVAA